MNAMGEHHPHRKIGDVEVVSAVSGRVRLRVKDTTDTDTIDALTRHFKGQTGIDEIRTNPDTGSLTVRFDPASATVSEIFEPLALQEIAPLSNGSDDESQAAIGSEDLQTALVRLKSFVPPLLGIAIVRALRIYGWTALPAYLLATAVSRQILETVDFDGFRDGDEVSSEIPAEDSSTVETVQAIALADIVVHDTPGRLRLRLPPVAENATFGKRLQKLAAIEEGITAVRINPANASVTVTYSKNRSSREIRARIASLLLATEMLEVPTVEPPSRTRDTEDKNGKASSAKEDDTGYIPPEPPEISESDPSDSTTSEAETSEAEISEADPSDSTTSEAETSEAETSESEIPEASNTWSRFKSSAMSVVLDWMANTSLGRA
ncbi:hypothetical protein [Baaleninema simplex]|uniref:hypothetical protein n=1 Tax=Baaleninema simplex TaxID=2862350 RepID=UPI001181C422|nr:hypothetical protein [Baaleninema simplex]